MSVDLTIQGDPAAINELADWLSQAKDALVGVDLELAYVSGDTSMYLGGEAGNAFHAAAGTVRDRMNPVSPYFSDAAQVFHAYAHRLERGIRDFNSYLEQCREQGLTVYGKTVMRPTSTAQVCAQPGVNAEWDLYIARLRTYSDLSERVGTWWGELEAWIAENMTPLLAEVEKFAPLNTAFNGLAQDNDDVVAHVFTGTDRLTQDSLSKWRAYAQDLQQDADSFQRGLRSKNPAVLAAAEEANPRAMRTAVNGIVDDIHSVSKAGKLIPVAGKVIEIVSAAGAIADGESGSSVLVEAFAGLGGGAAVGGTIAAFGGPVGWVITGVIGGGIAIGAGARWGWEAAVPIDTREAIDGWLYDGTSLWQGPQLAK